MKIFAYAIPLTLLENRIKSPLTASSRYLPPIAEGLV